MVGVAFGVPAVATQAEAEAGTDTTKRMSPLRTAQAITALASSGGVSAPINLIRNSDVYDRVLTQNLNSIRSKGNDALAEWWDEGPSGLTAFTAYRDPNAAIILVADSGPDASIGAVYALNSAATVTFRMDVTKVSGDGSVRLQVTQLTGAVSNGSTTDSLNKISGTGDASITITFVAMQTRFGLSTPAAPAPEKHVTFNLQANASHGLEQVFDFVDEPTLKVGTVISAAVKIFVATANKTVDLDQLDQDDNVIGTAQSTTAAESAYERITVEDVTIGAGDTAHKWRCTTTSAAATNFDMTEPVLNVGATALSTYKPRKFSKPIAISLSATAFSVTAGDTADTAFSLASVLPPTAVSVSGKITLGEDGASAASSFAALYHGHDTLDNVFNSVAIIRFNGVPSLLTIWMSFADLLLTDAQEGRYAISETDADSDVSFSVYAQSYRTWEGARA